MPRVVSVWLPSWPLQRLRRASATAPEGPFVLVAASTRGLRVSATNRAARAAGVAVGMAHADACAIVPGLLSAPAEPEADAAALAALAGWCDRYTPIAATDGLDGLVLDVTGCGGLWGGEGRLVEDLLRRLRRGGLLGWAALADSWGAAWACARYAPPQVRLVPPGAERTILAPLPMAGLRLRAETLTLLARLGLRRIGDLYPIPREALARRLRTADPEADLPLRLDQALGLRPEPIAALAQPPDHRETLALPEPLLAPEAIAAGLDLLLDRLTHRLEARSAGARHLRLDAFGPLGERQHIEVRTSRPSRNKAHLSRLFAERLPRIDPGFGIERLVLRALETQPLQPLQSGFASREDEAAEEALAQLADRLATRLGPRAVWRTAPVESHWPEHSERQVGPEAAPACWSVREGPERPLRLFATPEPIRVVAAVPDGVPSSLTWRRVTRRIRKAQGPERLAGEWWRGAEGTRDYYAVEDEAGRRYWVFRAGFYGEADAPSWFLHGLFA